MILDALEAVARMLGKPRTRGDDPPVVFATYLSLGKPRTRGDDPLAFCEAYTNRK